MTTYLSERRDAFYKWAKNELNLEREAVRKILLENDYKEFKESEISKYKAAVRYAYSQMHGVKERVAKALQKSQEDAEIRRVNRMCKVPGCYGEWREKRRNERGWHVTCSEGGAAHHIIWLVGRLMVLKGVCDTEEEAMLKLIEERSLYDEKEKETTVAAEGQEEG